MKIEINATQSIFKVAVAWLLSVTPHSGPQGNPGLG
jgi:hypothetical protein